MRDCSWQPKPYQYRPKAALNITYVFGRKPQLSASSRRFQRVLLAESSLYDELPSYLVAAREYQRFLNKINAKI